MSRQRAWGVPIAVFTHRETGEPLRDAVVVERVAAAVEREGSDVWFRADASQFLGNSYDPAEWEKVTDIIEVWFDSGSTHAFVLEQRPELNGRPRFISKARTSIAAGFTPRCSKPAALAAAPLTTPC